MNSADEFYEEIAKYDEGKHKRDPRGQFTRAGDAMMETDQALSHDKEYQSRQKKAAVGATVGLGGAAVGVLSRHPGAVNGGLATGLAGATYASVQSHKGNKRAKKVAKPIFERHGVGDLIKRDIESPFIRKALRDADPKVSKSEPGYKLFTGFDDSSGKTKGQQLLEHMQHNGRARDAEVAADEARHASSDAGIARRALRVRKSESPFIAKAVGTQNRMAGMQQTESAMQQNAMQQATEMLAPQVAQQVMQMQQEAEQQFMQEQQQLAMLGQQMNAGTPQSNLNTGPGTQGTYEMGPQLRGPRMSAPPSLRSLSAGPKGPAIGPQ